MSNIPVANGWQHILTEALEQAAALPDEWCFEIVSAKTVDGALKLSATYVSGDVPLDDHLPPERKLPHPWRAMTQIRKRAREKSFQTCECCGRMGQMIAAGETARVRCAAHVDVVDAMSWLPPEGVMFETSEEAMAHFLSDFGDGLDAMQEMARNGDDDKRD
ncbi:hypothetical protein [Rhizobium sp. BK176]|uniref:hypothetical protein n=1 Tax=Rhizobium sp. BK176 TaxID=2587071 RepID=UPI002168A9BF|nr:hypothetical protein [Rhizobium sp. BK176]MCS4092600.1 hypothetical protein [Rhizobium sp. BK176]